MENEQKEYRQLTNLKEFEFSKTPVFAGIVKTTEMIALKPVCENLGLSWKGAHQRIQRNEELTQLSVLSKGIGKDGKSYEMLCLPPSAFQEWLFFLNDATGENLNRELLIEYQKGLVIHLLMMLKVSLDEVQRLKHIEDSFSRLSLLVANRNKIDDDISYYQDKTKELRDRKKLVDKDIHEILTSEAIQMPIPYPTFN